MTCIVPWFTFTSRLFPNGASNSNVEQPTNMEQNSLGASAARLVLFRTFGRKWSHVARWISFPLWPTILRLGVLSSKVYHWAPSGDKNWQFLIGILRFWFVVFSGFLACLTAGELVFKKNGKCPWVSSIFFLNWGVNQNQLHTQKQG